MADYDLGICIHGLRVWLLARQFLLLAHINIYPRVPTLCAFDRLGNRLFQPRQLGQQLLPLNFVGLDWYDDFALLRIAFLDRAGDKGLRMRYTHTGPAETYHWHVRYLH